jgi:hypothetical protein
MPKKKELTCMTDSQRLFVTTVVSEYCVNLALAFAAHQKDQPLEEGQRQEACRGILFCLRAYATVYGIRNEVMTYLAETKRKHGLS